MIVVFKKELKVVNIDIKDSDLKDVFVDYISIFLISFIIIFN